MTESEAKVLSLLSYELSGSPVRLTKNTDFNEIYSFAVRHAIVPLLYKSVKHLCHEYSEDKDFISNIQSSAILSACNSDRLMTVQDGVLRLLQNNSIPCVILKGCSVAVYYPHPELRQLGDIDILVPNTLVEKAKDVLLENGYKFNYQGHHFHYAFEAQGIEIELHWQITEFADNEAGMYASSFFDKSLQETETSSYNSYSFPVFRPVYQLLSLLFHMSRHMTQSGIGLRQLCDWHVSIDHFRNDIDDSVLLAMKSCGLFNFASLLTQCCVVYLNLKPFSWCEKASRQLCKDLFSEIIDSGNMAQITSERKISSAFLNNDLSKNKSRFFIISYIGSMNKIANNRYPLTKILPFLLPFFWMMIPLTFYCRMLFGKRKSVSVVSTIASSKRRLKLYNHIGFYKPE